MYVGKLHRFALRPCDEFFVISNSQIVGSEDLPERRKALTPKRLVAITCNSSWQVGLKLPLFPLGQGYSAARLGKQRIRLASNQVVRAGGGYVH